MSMCAQARPLVKRLRNIAAVIEPPGRPPMFFTSATWLSISLSYCAGSGMRQSASPVALRGRQQVRRQRLVVAVEARQILAERDDDRAGQRRQVDHELAA